MQIYFVIRMVGEHTGEHRTQQLALDVLALGAVVLYARLATTLAQTVPKGGEAALTSQNLLTLGISAMLPVMAWFLILSVVPLERGR